MKAAKLFASLLAVIFIISPIIGAKAQGGELENSPETPLTGAFTYQGYLTDDLGEPYTDSCQFNVTLWDAPTLGNQIGATDTNPGIQVMDGYFTMSLNESNQFGAQPFNGEARYLEIAVACPSAGTQELLSPRQLLRAAPYAVYSLTVPAHDHAGETWIDSNEQSILTLENTYPMGGIGLTVASAPGNVALYVDGALKSTADTEIFLSPFDFIDLLGVTGLGYGSNGGYVVRLDPDSTAEFLLPLQVPGELLGTPVFVKSLEICYMSEGPTMGIALTAVGKNDGPANPRVDYLSSNTLQNSPSYTCYTVDAQSPYKVIDRSSFVWLILENTHATFYLNLYFFSIKLTLSENWN